MKRRSSWVTCLIPLPVLHNPDAAGRRVEVGDDAFSRTAEEIARRFGGGVLHRFRDGQVRGFWWDRGVLWPDTLAALEVDVPNTSTSRAWLRSYARDTLLGRFRQAAIYLKFVGPIERIVVEEEAVVPARGHGRES